VPAADASAVHGDTAVDRAFPAVDPLETVVCRHSRATGENA